MIHVNCPNCDKRLRAPRTAKPIALRCPSCKHVFETPAPALVEAGGDGQYVATGADEMAVAAGAPARQATEGAGPIVASLLSPADEALLRDLGSGSGLLELTREAYGVSVTDPAQYAARAAEAAEPSAPTDALPAGKELDRQFQIVTTALVLANRLVDAHKLDARRSRANARFAWIGVACVAALGVLTLWWATTQSGKVNLEQANAVGLQRQMADLQTTLTQERDRSSRAGEEASKLRTERDKLLTDLTTARESAAENKASVQILTANLEAAKARASELTLRLEQARATSQPTTQPEKTAIRP